MDYKAKLQLNNNELEGNNIDLQTILDTINALPEAGSSAELPELTNPADASKTLLGYEFINEDGNKIIGTMPTATQAAPSISIDNSGLITAIATQTAGYVSAGTETGTKQLTTQAAKTVTPSTNSQTAVASGVYTTGAVTVDAIPSKYVDNSTVTAVESDVISGKKFGAAGSVKTGTMTNRTIVGQNGTVGFNANYPNAPVNPAVKTTIALNTDGVKRLCLKAPEGYYHNDCYVAANEPNLVAGNIKSGVSIFGVAGSLQTGVTVQKKSGTYTTNNSGSATVDCGFKPDAVFITAKGTYGTSYGGVDFTGGTTSNMTVYCSSNGSSYVFAQHTFAQSSTGFTVSAKQYNSSFSSSTDRNRTVTYLAVKYT